MPCMPTPDELSELEAAEIYGKRQPRSGSGMFDKMDVIGTKEKGFEGYIIENKWTGKQSFSINRAIIDKARRQSRYENKIPLIRVDLNSEEVYICIKEDDFLRLFADEL